MIDSYDFGVIMIGGKKYSSDIIIFPDRVLDGWWRKEGHRLYIDDLKEVLDEDPLPHILIIGTGYSGLMNVTSEVEEEMKTRRIELIVEPTKLACTKFNELINSERKIVAALHLTC